MQLNTVHAPYFENFCQPSQSQLSPYIYQHRPSLESPCLKNKQRVFYIVRLAEINRVMTLVNAYNVATLLLTQTQFETFNELRGKGRGDWRNDKKDRRAVNNEMGTRN